MHSSALIVYGSFWRTLWTSVFSFIRIVAFSESARTSCHTPSYSTTGLSSRNASGFSGVGPWAKIIMDAPQSGSKVSLVLGWFSMTSVNLFETE